MYSALFTFNTTTEVSLSKAPNPQLLPACHSINDCPLLQVCVHGLCVCSLLCVCTLDGLNHHTWLYVTLLSLLFYSDSENRALGHSSVWQCVLTKWEEDPHLVMWSEVCLCGDVLDGRCFFGTLFVTLIDKWMWLQQMHTSIWGLEPQQSLISPLTSPLFHFSFQCTLHFCLSLPHKHPSFPLSVKRWTLMKSVCVCVCVVCVCVCVCVVCVCVCVL